MIFKNKNKYISIFNDENKNNEVTIFNFPKFHKAKKPIQLFILLVLIIYLIFTIKIMIKKNIINREKNENKITDKLKGKESHDNSLQINKFEKKIFENEINRYHLKEINKKRSFDIKIPLPKEIKCKPHFTKNELIGFLSFLNKNNIYFETGSGCSSIIAKYYSKKSYAVEGCKYWYEMGIKNGLKDNLIFKDLKPDNKIWSYPGKATTVEDWKNYFQSYDKKYNADVILIDGRFKVATALDIFDKIKNDTIVLVHEYQFRPSYFIIEKYYDYVYHWDYLTAFVKKKNIKSIPLKIQKKYWDLFL